MAIKNTSVALGEPFIQFARRKVESGEFATTSEVVREAMRRYIADDVKLQALRAAIQEGIDSGPPEPFDADEFIAEMRSRHGSGDAA
jgi:antitoxin ParD1/3/4